MADERPNISHLAPGIFAGHNPDGTAAPLLPLFDVGDRIVVEVRTRLLRGDPPPWLETLVGTVRSIDDETGLVTIADEASDARAPAIRRTSFRDGLHDFRLAPLKGNPFK